MQHRRALIGLAGAIAIIGLWYAFRPERLFINKTVNESFGAAVGEEASGSAMSAVRSATNADARGAMTLAAGHFHRVAHDTHGTATIYRLADGRRVLRFTDFKTSNGPDVRVYLIAASDASDNETVTKRGYVEVAPIKGNEGDQNYDLPASLDLSKYHAVTIWCRRFSVNFATAPLSPAS